MAKKATSGKTDMVLTRGVSEVFVREHLSRDLAKGDLLRVKLGMDPTAPDLHLGHAVVLRKLREFQDLGHQVVLIIGDYTAMIGDPSGRSKTRPPLSPAQIDANASTYLAQAGKVLDMSTVEVHKNSEWLRELSFADILKLAAHFTVARTIERDDFSKRLAAGADVGLHELLYPLMQAYDSVAIKASVEIGGTDQKFNLLAGRELQKKLGEPEQDVVTCPLLVGLDGIEKMSKSLGNYVGLADAPVEMYGKLMTVPDAHLVTYYELATALTPDEVAKVKGALESGENPRDLKMRLAREVVTLYHSKSDAEKAEAMFVKTFQKHETPDEVPVKKIGGDLPLARLLLEIGFAKSISEARRTVEQRGVKVAGKVVADPDAKVFATKSGVVIQKGKRFFVRVTA